MKLNGTHTLDASLDHVWNMLLDPDVLARITPGIQTLEPLGDDKFKAVSDVKIGPVKGSFSGNMEVVDKVDKEGFGLKIKQNSKIGNVKAEGKIKLRSIGSQQTEIEFSGSAQLSGTLARTGQRVLSGVARTMTDQFFQSLREELQLSKGIEVEKVGWWTKFLRWLRSFFGKD